MKKFFNVCRNVLAVIGLIAVLAVVLYFCRKPYFEIDVYPSYLARMEKYVDLLRTSGPFAKDTASYSIRIIQDTVRAKEIRDYFPEIRAYNNQCRFDDCTHVHEPDCAVMKAVEQGLIAETRYLNYLAILEDDDMKLADWKLD